MDWQDVFSLIIFLLLVTFSKKKKPIDEDESSSEEAPTFSEIDTVRKKIEALKRQRSGVPKENVATQGKPVKERPIFSAYKHLPEPETVESTARLEVTPIASVEETPKEVMKSIDLPRKRSRLHDWVVGQIVLGTPAYRRYGNCIHR
jgi:hypothetical protein